jgi:hypothetical protein
MRHRSVHRDRHLGVGFAKSANDTRHEGMKRTRRSRPQGDPAQHASCSPSRRLERAIYLREDCARIVEECATGSGQFDAARLSAKQLDAQFAFNRLDLPAERRLLHSKPFRSPRDVAFLGGGDEIAEMPEFHVIPVGYGFWPGPIMVGLVQECYRCLVGKEQLKAAPCAGEQFKR